jgi:tryptophan synthase alpha subunit
VNLVAPTSTEERIRVAAESSDGWLYVVTVTGTTGVREQASTRLGELVTRVRAVAPDLPLYAGFGIATPEHAAQTAELVDGVVVGSRAVQVAEQGPEPLREYVSSLRAAIDAVPAAVS